MKKIFIATMTAFLFGISSFADESAPLAGKWIGVCKSVIDGKEKSSPSKLKIVQFGHMRVKIAGHSYIIGETDEYKINFLGLFYLRMREYATFDGETLIVSKTVVGALRNKHDDDKNVGETTTYSIDTGRLVVKTSSDADAMTQKSETCVYAKK